MNNFEDWVNQVKEEYNKLSAEDILEEFVSLNDELLSFDGNRDVSENYKLLKKRYDIVKFLILERLHYFDCGDDGIPG